MAYKVALNYFTGELQLVTALTGSSGVIGIPPTTPGAIATWVDTAATTIQNTDTFVQAGGGIQASGFLTKRGVTTLVSIPSGYSWIAPELEVELSGAIELEPDGELIII